MSPRCSRASPTRSSTRPTTSRSATCPASPGWTPTPWPGPASTRWPWAARSPSPAPSTNWPRAPSASSRAPSCAPCPPATAAPDPRPTYAHRPLRITGPTYPSGHAPPRQATPVTCGHAIVMGMFARAPYSGGAMASEDRIPDKLGPYRLQERLGEGGMGAVYLARDREKRPVAGKVLHSRVAAEPTARRRLAREVEAMRRVQSPFVAQVLDADVDSKFPYIVTRYVPGQTLDHSVREHVPLSPAALERLARGLAQALAAVHAAGVVHRDLKPGNVMLHNGDPVVIDFGIAYTGADSTRLTQTGMFMGTPGYLAPEVIEGQVSSEPPDIHPGGATLAFPAPGRPPFGTGSFENVFYRIVQGHADIDGVPAPLAQLVAASLSRDPRRRPTASWLSQQSGAPGLTAGPPMLTGAV